MHDLSELADIPCDIMNPRFPKCQAITIGRSIVCDGYHSERTTAVFSHFHEDHTYNIARTLTRCHHVIMSQTTYDALRGMNKISERGTIKPLANGRPFHTELGEKIELLDANHIPGSSQVLVTMEDSGEKVLYSGDFCYPGIAAPKADVLVLEPEHGEAIYDFHTDKQSVLRRIFDKTLEEIEQGNSVVIKSHRGTMQDIMAQLEEATDGLSIPEKVPFLASETDVNLTNAIKNTYSSNFRNIKSVSNRELNNLYGERQPYVLFSCHGNKKNPQEERGIVIHVDANRGFRKNGAFFTHDNHTYFACLASHSSFTHVMEYVKEVDPKLVIIDGTRVNTDTVENLQSSINNDLQIRAVVKTCTS